MIISDATALITLINIDEFRVLSLFTEHIVITPEVYDEVIQHADARRYMREQKEKGFISIEHYTDSSYFDAFCYLLDEGEAASITLALEKKLPLIIDEKKGRKFAQAQGVEIIGLVGILKYLYTKNILTKEETQSIVQKLNVSDFRISPALLDLILKHS